MSKQRAFLKVGFRGRLEKDLECQNSDGMSGIGKKVGGRDDQQRIACDPREQGGTKCHSETMHNMNARSWTGERFHRQNEPVSC